MFNLDQSSTVEKKLVKIEHKYNGIYGELMDINRSRIINSGLYLVDVESLSIVDLCKEQKAIGIIPDTPPTTILILKPVNNTLEDITSTGMVKYIKESYPLNETLFTSISAARFSLKEKLNNRLNEIEKRKEDIQIVIQEIDYSLSNGLPDDKTTNKVVIEVDKNIENRMEEDIKKLNESKLETKSEKKTEIDNLKITPEYLFTAVTLLKKCNNCFSGNMSTDLRLDIATFLNSVKGYCHSVLEKTNDRN